MKPLLNYFLFGALTLVVHEFLAQNSKLKLEQEGENCPQIDLTPDNPIIVQMDAMMKAHYFSKNKLVTDITKLNSYKFPVDSVPFYSDEEFQQRLQVLDNETPFKLAYNSNVKGFIHLYSVRKRELTSRILGLSHTYFPMFEELLDKYNLPLEFKYLAVVESALNPTAKSRSGAMGLWQFMYPTGKMFGLNVTSYEDERMDPYKATEAACKYFQHLYKIYGNWELVLAAYNCGPGTVNKALRRSGNKTDYWELWSYLPSETRGYVPAFIAVNYVMNHATEHNLYPVEPIKTFFEYDTIHIEREISLEQIAYTMEIPLDQLTFLNPGFKLGIIPNNGKKNILYLPHEKVGDFINNEALIFETKLNSVDSVSVDEPEFVVAETKKIHTVRRGDFLGQIADKYNCSVNDIKIWNNMRSTKIYQGQKLTILVSEKVEAIETAQKTTPSNQSVYTVQKGDTLWSIAVARGITVEKLKEFNKAIDETNLKAGMKLVVNSGS